MPRQTDYTEEIGVKICTRLASGEPLVKICSDEDMPHVATVYRWLSANYEFQRLYEQARLDQADTLASEILEIADEPPEVLLESAKDETDKVIARVDSAAVHHQRLRVEARKWVASKLKPKKYGEHQQIEHTGPDGAPLDMTGLSNLELARRILFLLNLGAREADEIRARAIRPRLPITINHDEEE